MKLCGLNCTFQLGEKSNKNSEGGYSCISPFCASHLSIPSLLSYSLNNHAVFVTKEGHAFALGYSKDKKIITINQRHLSVPKEQQIEIQDKEGKNCTFISAVAGYHYTLYLVSSESEKINRLVYTHFNKNSDPYFLNLNGHSPAYLFGGSETAVAVSTEGVIFIIIPSVIESPEIRVEGTVLPNDEIPINFACCLNFIIALSSSGVAYEALVEPIKTQRNTKPNFKKIEFFEDEEIIDVSGTNDHCFVVLKDGRVFGKGSNSLGNLGIGQGVKYESEFHEIPSLKKYKIVSTSAGNGHSFFITSEGKVLGCGSNCRGELFLNDEPSFYWKFNPVETVITSGATFCIAGTNASAAFVGCDPPINSPNQAIKIERKKKRKVEDIEEENERLKKEIKSLRSQISLLKKVSSLEKKDLRILDSENIDDLAKIEEIGSSGECKVYKVLEKKFYLLKELRINDLSTKNLQCLIKEYEIMNMMNHPNIMKTFGIFLSDENRPPSILLEYCDKNLEQEIINKSLTNVQIVFYIYQIVEGMKQVHSYKIIHCDLNPSNIFIKSDDTIKISGFETAKLMESDGKLSNISIKPNKFASPEIIDEVEYNEKVDVYSFGVLLFFVMNNGDLSKIKISDILRGKKPKIPDTFDPFVIKLIDDCLNFEAKDRPSFDDILQRMEDNNFQLFTLTNKELNDVKARIIDHKDKLPM